MFCSRCGSPYPEDANYCPRCGRDLGIQPVDIGISPVLSAVNLPHERKFGLIFTVMGLWVLGIISTAVVLGVHNNITLLQLAVTPPLIFLVFIMYMDRSEPEPLGLIIKVMALGALSAVPAAFLEWALGLMPVITHSGALVESFIRIAPVEEACKLAVVLLFIWNHPAFNEENDGIVYMSASAIGFAVLENILYVLHLGFNIAIMRAVTAIPLHTFTGVIMGYSVGLAKFSNRPKLNVFKGFLLAYLFHGLYDTFGLSQSVLGWLLFPTVILVVVCGILFLRKGRQLSLKRWSAAGGILNTRGAADRAGKGQRWKIVISRILFCCSGVYWLLLTGYKAQEPSISLESLITQGLLITFLPILVGVMLEASYHHHKKPPYRQMPLQ